jgi:hypothetical protein
LNEARGIATGMSLFIRIDAASRGVVVFFANRVRLKWMNLRENVSIFG